MKCTRFIWVGIILICILASGCAEETEKTEKHSPYSLPLTERNFYIGMVPTPKSVPETTFEDITASVGLTERQAREKGYNVKVGKFDYANLTRAIVSDETDGFIKIVAEGGSGRILGGHIVEAEASSLIHEIAAAMAGGMMVSDIGNTLHAYPTLSEGVRYACQAAM